MPISTIYSVMLRLSGFELYSRWVPLQQPRLARFSILPNIRDTQQEYSSKPLKHSIIKRILVFQR